MPQGDAFPFVRMWRTPPSPGRVSQVADRPGGDRARLQLPGFRLICSGEEGALGMWSCYFPGS